MFLNQWMHQNDSLILVCLCLAVFRIYLELIGFDLRKLPLTGRMGAQGMSFHRFGLIVSIGYILLFAPQFLIS